MSYLIMSHLFYFLFQVEKSSFIWKDMFSSEILLELIKHAIQLHITISIIFQILSFREIWSEFIIMAYCGIQMYNRNVAHKVLWKSTLIPNVLDGYRQYVVTIYRRKLFLGKVKKHCRRITTSYSSAYMLPLEMAYWNHVICYL